MDRSLAVRLIIASLCCMLVIAFAWRTQHDASPELRMARTLDGEHWYRLSLAGRHVGYWRTRNHRDAEGHWAFESEQRFALNATDQLSTFSRRVFDRTPPHRLLRAEHIQTRRGRESGILILADGNRYTVNRIPVDGTPQRQLTLNYRLADYLGFELWLAESRPAAGSRRTVQTLDFERLALVGRSFHVLAREDGGYLIENAAPLAATRITLDTDYVPRQIRISGLFDLDRSSRAEALAPRSTLHAASFRIPTDRRLADPTRISHLVLGFEGTEAPDSFFPEARVRHGIWQLDLRAPPLSAGAPGPDENRTETLQLPSRHPEIAALATGAVSGEGTVREQAQALTRFVHRYLSYDPGESGQAVIDLLDNPRGDCTEYADLLTTLARNLGIPARTVFGLAYHDSADPAFAYHAWNELYVDGAWTPMDPTWNLVRVDATHIPLPADTTAALGLLTGSVDLSFSILEVAHFPD